MPAEQTDLLILGAGAAGLVAAAFAARGGIRTRILEKGRQSGVKILVAGGGHCNLTHDGAVGAVLEGFGLAAGFLAPSMRAFSPRAVRRHFTRLGVPTYVGERAEVWPVSRSARQVRDALEADARAGGAEIRVEAAATAVERTARGFRVITPAGVARCRRLLLATGGMSYPKTGTTGDGYRLAGQLGHGLVEPVPALVPLVVEAPWLRVLAGIALDDVAVRLRTRGGEELGASRGPVVLTHKGLSGPAAMDLGGRVARHGRRAVLAIDWRPEVRAEAVDRDLRAPAAGGGRLARRLLAGWVPERLATALAAVAGVPADRTAAQLRIEERRALVGALKETHVAVAGTLGFGRAEVTAGGVPLEEVDPVRLESRIVPGLFFAGEVLDYDGRLGGYNLQAAFCTGKAAGLAAAAP
ncbi:MAG: aminoacetone oxidase family FAD-binding enzyme [Planctomycetes bacterium]|nr:aminoacetone oxidase family FAD-binding enzyme [Planctomycetota bacterium]